MNVQSRYNTISYRGLSNDVTLVVSNPLVTFVRNHQSYNPILLQWIHERNMNNAIQKADFIYTSNDSYMDQDSNARTVNLRLDQ